MFSHSLTHILGRYRYLAFQTHVRLALAAAAAAQTTGDDQPQTAVPQKLAH